MEFTGERMIPKYNKGGVTYLEHIARYFFVSQFVKNKNVLDIACGSGYGSAMILEAGAKKVAGVDISQETISFCKEKYGHRGIEFIQGSVVKIPMEDESLDVVVSFETIEHVGKEEQQIFLKEVKRILKKEGLFIVSTPNSDIYPKGNEFHVHEMEPNEFRLAIGDNFKNSKIFYQDDVACSYILQEKNSETKGFINNVELLDLEKSEYMIAICSDGEIMKVDNLIGLSDWKPYKDHIVYKEGIVDDGEINSLLLEKENELRFMKSSKFWKMRDYYIKFKQQLIFLLFSPRKFVKKYLKI